MHDLLKKDSDLGTGHSVAPNIIGWWTPTESQIQQSCLSKSLSLKMATPPPHCQATKQMNFHFQEQDSSSSTQSSAQSFSEVASVGESNPYGPNTLPICTGYNGNHGQLEEAHCKSAFSMENQDNLYPPGDCRQQYTCVPLPFPEPCHHGSLSTYGPSYINQPHMMGSVSARVPLPLDLAHDEPIYVNAKQYHAILRRRQYRAKLEAENKLSKNRKPYLHESRHLHALKRARGSGGRFLNRKKLEETASGAAPDVSRTSHIRMTRKTLESELHSSLEDFKEAPSNINSIFKQQEFSFSTYPSHVSRPIGLPSRNHHSLSVNH